MNPYSESLQHSRDRSFHAAVMLTLAAIVLLLGGCAGPGSRDSDRASDYQRLVPGEIPDAVPRVEPRSKYGNMASYTVGGRLYYTKQDARGHVERGKASWYGKKFNGRRTSSGEPYDMYAMSAAHKTLPLPCYARITNLDNGRSAVVRINDRGPFHSNRIIDLSYAAATKIGVFPKGTAIVEVRGLDPAPPDAASSVVSTGSRGRSTSDDSPFFANAFANTEHQSQSNQYRPNEDAIAQSLAIASRGGLARQRLTSRSVDSSVRERAVTAAFSTVEATPMSASAQTSFPKTSAENGLSAVEARGPDIGRETKAAGQGQGLYLQIGAFGDPRNAERLRERLGSELAAQVRIQQPGEGAPNLYKVRIGPLDSEGEARRLSAQISTLGLSEQPRLIWN